MCVVKFLKYKHETVNIGYCWAVKRRLSCLIFLYFYIIFIFTSVPTKNKSNFDKYNREWASRTGMVFALSQTSQICHEGWNVQLSIIYWFAEGTAAVLSSAWCNITPQMAFNCIIFVRLTISAKKPKGNWRDSNNFFILWSLRLRNIMKIGSRTLLSISWLNN